MLESVSWLCIRICEKVPSEGQLPAVEMRVRFQKSNRPIWRLLFYHSCGEFHSQLLLKPWVRGRSQEDLGPGEAWAVGVFLGKERGDIHACLKSLPFKHKPAWGQ